jgi:hypothetical protein
MTSAEAMTLDPKAKSPARARLSFEVPPRFELGMVVLQTTALPLGDGTDLREGF